MTNLSQLDELELFVATVGGKPLIVRLGEYPSVTTTIKSLMLEERLDELSKVWGGMNTAGSIRDGGYSARNLNLDDLSYWIHNRRRVLRGEKALTPEEWLEAER